MKQRKKTIIGRNVKIHFNRRMDVPAKVDTGADSSAVWASNIRVGKDGVRAHHITQVN